MTACPDCLAELRLDPQRAAEMLSVTLAQGFYPSRVAGSVPFATGLACTLLRARPHASLIFVGDDGFLEAHVEGRDHRAVAPLSCRDLDGEELFRIDRYDAAEDAVVAYGPDGAALVTFLRRQSGFLPLVDVRDETSAPVAALRPGPGGVGDGLLLVETGGSAVARVTYNEVVTDGWVDDEWSVRPTVEVDRLPLRPLAIVALPLAAKMLLGRVTPSKVQTPGRLQTDYFEEDS
ncbi:MAG TPA: hypothetical protein VF244_10205 [Acidimicrobiales bacterium]